MEILKFLVAMVATVEGARRLQAGSCCAFSPTKLSVAQALQSSGDTWHSAASAGVSQSLHASFVGLKAQHDPAWRRRTLSTELAQVAAMATSNFKISIMSLPAHGD